MPNQEHKRERDQTHSYWYIPSAPRVNYSLLVMESAGMMKMATGEGSPLRQGVGTGSRLVFGGYRGLRPWNSRSILFPEVFRVYWYIYVKDVRQGSHEGPTRVEGAPTPLPRASLVALLTCTPSLTGCFLSKNNFSRRFHSVSTAFDIPFLRNTETREKTETGTGLWVNRLVPKII